MTDPCTAAGLHQQVNDAIAAGRHAVCLPSGEHAIHGGWLPERFCHVSNNDHGLKRILFDIEGARDFVLDGNGARFTCFGAVLPIRIGHGERVTVKNLTIDWWRPFFTQAVVAESGPGWLSFQYDAARYPLRVDGGRLLACDGHGWQSDLLWNLLPFDAGRREVCSRIENWHLSRFHRAFVLAKNGIRLEANFAECYAPGTHIVLMHGNRAAPAIWIEESNNVTVQDVTIHHAPGMGVLAQLSRDVTVRRVNVEPSGDRLFSTWVDATHFVDCNGATRLLDCALRGQFDDAANIHASFSLVTKRLSSRTARLQHVHPQRYGRNAATTGVGVAFYRRRDMTRLLVTRVLGAETLNQEFCDVTIADDLPSEPGELICARFDPESTVEVRGCRFGANRGRGLLINMEHHVRVEDNHIHVSGRAIESMPDANYWWEGSPVQDLIIRNNTFEDCCFGPCGDDIIFVGPELPDGSDPRGQPIRATGQAPAVRCATPALRNIRIQDNTIIRHRGCLLHAHGVDGLTFTGNRVSDSARYPLDLRGRACFIDNNVLNAEIEYPCASTS